VLTSVKIPEGIDGKAFIKRTRQEYGVSIAGGQVHLMGKIFRLAHMGFMGRMDVLIGISATEMMLAELGYAVELGKGVGAAERALLNQKAAVPA